MKCTFRDGGLPRNLRLMPADFMPSDEQGVNEVLAYEGVSSVGIVAIPGGLVGVVYAVAEADRSGRPGRLIVGWAGTGAAEAALAYALGYAAGMKASSRER